MKNDEDDMLLKKIRIYIFCFAGAMVYFPWLIYLMNRWL